ncbi:MAG: hypothetical protein R3D55_25630 [Chloroflexota bacterium]
MLEQLNEPRSALTLQRWLNVQSQQRANLTTMALSYFWHDW